MSKEILFVLFDGRARNGNTDNAAIMYTADDENECRDYANEYGDDAVWFEFDCVENNLINPKMRLDLSPKLND